MISRFKIYFFPSVEVMVEFTKPLEAIRIFQKMKEYECERTQKSYITVFAILVGENQLKLALRFYRYMREKGIPPSVTSLNVLIKALCKNSGTMDAALKIFHEMPNRGCIPDSYTYGTLISGLCRFGKTNEAKELFLEMSDKGCSPTVVTYSSLIHGLCQSNNLDEAMGLLDDMKRKGIEPNVFTFSSLMDGLCKGGHSSQAMELLEIMVSKRHKPNTITYSTLIHGLCKEGKLRESLEILDRMKLQGLKPDAGLYWKIINGFCEVRKFQKAANFIDEMVLDGITPNRVTWSLHVRIHNTVVQGLLSESEPNRAFQLYLSMRSRGLSVEAKTFDLLINCFCKKGDLHKAARIVEEMVLDGCIPDEGTWTAIVSGFWDRRKVRETADSIQIELMDEVVEVLLYRVVTQPWKLRIPDQCLIEAGHDTLIKQYFPLSVMLNRQGQPQRAINSNQGLAEGVTQRKWAIELGNQECNRE
ncbi:pentatricopeptide repeat (PPR) superfamily protein [Actinidia rufa]|uniref:Pentatricopeptide repeat (PPR) superfamily protein n=1 Tax=Actinidia rufa TaxID=165716 RepID=A0A7J0FWG5_9ERIC|nr:pentatricopeptide repeat (PPR) superfamily protein [Actinidia rufa]